LEKKKEVTMAPEMPTVVSSTDDVTAPYNVTLLPAVEKGEADWRDYRCVELENGVTVCLVHDATSKTTA
jgi:hypothetical protein